jgi:hypothetical protein
MIELRFHRDLYRGESIDEAVKLFGSVARFELAEEPAHWIVRVAADANEKTVANELANYALGLTLRERGAK